MKLIRAAAITVLLATIGVVVMVMLGGSPTDPRPTVRVRIGTAECVVRQPDGAITSCD